MMVSSFEIVTLYASFALVSTIAGGVRYEAPRNITKSGWFQEIQARAKGVEEER
jgi:hypothetical protein